MATMKKFFISAFLVATLSNVWALPETNDDFELGTTEAETQTETQADTFTTDINQSTSGDATDMESTDGDYEQVTTTSENGGIETGPNDFLVDTTFIVTVISETDLPTDSITTETNTIEPLFTRCTLYDSKVRCANGYQYDDSGLTSKTCTWNDVNNPKFCTESYCCNKTPALVTSCGKFIKCPGAYRSSYHEKCTPSPELAASCSESFCCLSKEDEMKYSTDCSKPESRVTCSTGFAYDGTGIWPKLCMTNDPSSWNYCSSEFCCNERGVYPINCGLFTTCPKGYKTSASEPCVPLQNYAGTCSIDYCCN